MKRGKCGFTGLMVSLSLILTPPTYAQFGPLSGSSSNYDASSALEDTVGGRYSNVVFDGQNLSERVVREIAEDPLVAWGAVQDEYGSETQGEVWLIVAKTDKFIYFHLTEEPNFEEDSTAYGGYTVKIKAIMTHQFYTFGYGSAVPVIGNDTDAFLVTTTKMMVNSALTDGEVQQFNISTAAEIDYLVHLYDVVQAYSQPLALSAGRRMSIQFFAPDGTELTDPISPYVVASSDSSSSVDCEAFGNSVGTLVSAFPAFAGLANAGLTALTESALEKILTAETGGLAGAIGVGTGLKLLAGAQAGAQAAIGTGLALVTNALYSALAEGACNAAVSVLDSIPPLDIDLPSVEDIVDGLTSTWVFVCTQFGDVVEYSESGGEVTVTSGCVAGHYEEVEQ
jgi:hypothetical protein